MPQVLFIKLLVIPSFPPHIGILIIQGLWKRETIRFLATLILLKYTRVARSRLYGKSESHDRTEEWEIGIIRTIRKRTIRPINNPERATPLTQLRQTSGKRLKIRISPRAILFN
jgi:hypothetical protein